VKGALPKLILAFDLDLHFHGFKIRAKVSHASAIVKSRVLSRDMLAFIRPDHSLC